ncbi:GIY-YIG nuclease family protein [Nocardia vinacea]|uniref:GIY-YIG nuclease family protein n=1 Tax=Nocardia vinacea TaxID=96468 RepID=A0ABZ1YRF3_9NOCA|nr:GIY-YIG nuclease family protein [Nocardia vinacea]
MQREKLDKERAHYQNVLDSLAGRTDEEAQRIRDKLGELDQAIAQNDYRRANIRAGYVYVISNRGAFGPDVVKIGMTRRLEPMDRVRELGSASVPFPFDVHALYFSDDAARSDGYVIGYGEVEPGYWGLGVPLARPDDEPAACVVLISASEELVRRVVADMLDAAAELSEYKG